MDPIATHRIPSSASDGSPALERETQSTSQCDILRPMLITMPSASVPVPFFRPRRQGPECAIEDRVIAHLPTLFESERPVWIAGSVPLGAGMPDLILTTYQALVARLAGAGAVDTNILAYLRVVARARPHTIATRLRLSPRVAEQRIAALSEAQALTDCAGAVALTPACRDVLPKVTAIEVKVNNWQRAVSQALRNRIFAHQSFIALPMGVAMRVRRDPTLFRSGVGVIGIDAGDASRVLKPSALGQPRVWAYYYKLAALVGQRVVGEQ